MAHPAPAGALFELRLRRGTARGDAGHPGVPDGGGARSGRKLIDDSSTHAGRSRQIERGPMEAALDIKAPSESVIRQLADIERLTKWVPEFRASMQVR